MPHTGILLFEHKQRLREEMRAKRQGHADNHAGTFKNMAALFVRDIELKPGSIVSSYHAFRDEMDPHHLNEALRAQGHKIALPVVVGKGLPLAFRLFEKDDVLARNAMGLHEPLPSGPEVVPDVLLVPLLAFDVLRNRLGYGGGFYDRTIAGIYAHKPVMTVGIAYDYQKVPHVPVGPHDRQLDRIVTEVNVL